MYFWVKIRDSKSHSPNVARSNRASLRCSIDPLPDRHERGVRIAQAQASRCGSRSEEHTSELQSQSNLVCRLLLEKKNNHSARRRQVFAPVCVSFVSHIGLAASAHLVVCSNIMPPL